MRKKRINISLRANRSYFIIVLVLTLVLFSLLVKGISASTPGNINSCQELNESGVYTLTRNLEASNVNLTGCFNITTSNVTLDCAGYYIKNITIENPGIYSDAEIKDLLQSYLNEIVS